MPQNRKLIYLPEAERDFREIVSFFLKGPGVPYARNVYTTMRDTIRKLRDYPLLGPVHPDPELAAIGYRKLVLTEIYVAIYKIEDSMVYVYRIVNGTTDYPKLLK